MAFDPRTLPVSSRLRNQRSPIDSRYMELKRAAARPRRSANLRMRHGSKKTVNYSELTDDEDDGTNSSSSEFTSEPEQRASSAGNTLDYSSESDLSQPVLQGTQQITAPYIDLIGEDVVEEVPAAATKVILKIKFEGSKSANTHKEQHPLQSTLSYPVRRQAFQSQMPTKCGKAHSKRMSSAKAMVIDNCHPASHTTQTVVAQGDIPATRPFKNLAIEVLQHIASYLPSDADVFNYRNTSRSTFASITSSVWRQRFIQKYDMIPGLNTDDIAQKYEERRKAMIDRPIFDLRVHGNLLDVRIQAALDLLQQKFLIILKDLLIESKNCSEIDSKGFAVVKGKNLQVIMDILSESNSRSYVDIVDAIFCTPWDKNVTTFENWTKIVDVNENSGKLYVVQLCLAPYYLGPSSKYRQRHFDVSQFHVYSHVQPLFFGPHKQVLNARLILHLVNFFQFHLKADGEGLLAHSYPSLLRDQLPHPWVGTIKEGLQPLGCHWKGIYTNLTERTLVKVRSWNGDKHLFAADHLEQSDAFQDISFFFDETQERPWPKRWEDVLCSDTFKKPFSGVDKTTKVKEGFRPEIKEFWGTSRKGDINGKNGHFFGRIHSMPPQQGIHGFQRVTLMKFDALNINDVDNYDGQNIWAYEGCVFPGGTIIAGRWWNPRRKWADKQSFGGPFLWWNVETPTTPLPIEPEEALEFQQTFFDQVYGLH